jgi:MFS family permease
VQANVLQAASLAFCRFFSGFGGCSSHAVFGGVLADIWNLKDRAKASGVLAGVTMIGPVLGPLAGGFLSESVSWRWTCWAPALASTTFQIVSVLFLNETFVPTLLQRKLRKAKQDRPDDELYTVLEFTPARKDVSRTKYLLTSIMRPIIYLFSDPALALLSLYYAFIFGVLYLVIVTFYEIFGIGGYGHSPGIVGVDLLSMGIGASIALVVTVKLLDIIYRWATKDKKQYRSETRYFGLQHGLKIWLT